MPSSSPSIAELANDLPEKSVTTLLLQELDFVMPGEWSNPHGFDAMIQQITG